MLVNGGGHRRRNDDTSCPVRLRSAGPTEGALIRRPGVVFDCRKPTSAHADSSLHGAVARIGVIDRTLANCGLCVRSHPPVLDALTALGAQD